MSERKGVELTFTNEKIQKNKKNYKKLLTNVKNYIKIKEHCVIGAEDMVDVA